MPLSQPLRLLCHALQTWVVSLLLGALLCTTSLASPVTEDHIYTNITIDLPSGSRYLPDEHLLCIPSNCKNILAFFLVNYGAHVATVKSLPGESAMGSLITILLALLFPSSGMLRGMDAVCKFANRPRLTPLQTACKAGALCVVTRTTDWTPRAGEVVKGIDMKIRWLQAQTDGMSIELQPYVLAVQSSFVSEPEATTNSAPEGGASYSPVPSGAGDTVSRLRHLEMCVERTPVEEDDDSFLPPTKFWHMTGRVVHSACELPHGYALLPLPPNTAVSTLEETPVSQQNPGKTASCRVDGISMSYSLSKAVVAIFQIFYASYTLYQTRGDQIARFGYAAFGLTVIPYLMMSLINLAANAATPDFPAMYLVRDDIMEEVEGRTGAEFERVVATIRQPPKLKTTSVQFIAPEAEVAGKEMWKVRRLPDKLDGDNVQWANDPVGAEADQFPFLNVEFKRHNPGEYLSPHSVARVPRSNTVEQSVTMDKDMFSGFLAFLFSSLPLALIGILTHFEKGDSTSAQRAWIMTWLVLGIPLGFLSRATVVWVDVFESVGLLPYGVPVFGGLLVVGQMLKAYGSCIRLF